MRSGGLCPTFRYKITRRKSIEDTINRIVMRGLPKDEEISRILSVVTASADSLIGSSQR